MAQTTRPASFGPVITVVDRAEPLRTFRQYVEPMNIIRYKKKHERKKNKTHLGTKRRETRRLGPFSSYNGGRIVAVVPVALNESKNKNSEKNIEKKMYQGLEMCCVSSPIFLPLHPYLPSHTVFVVSNLAVLGSVVVDVVVVVVMVVLAVVVLLHRCCRCGC